MAGKEFANKVRYIRLGRTCGERCGKWWTIGGKKETAPPCGHYLLKGDSQKRHYMGLNNISVHLTFFRTIFNLNVYVGYLHKGGYCILLNGRKHTVK